MNKLLSGEAKQDFRDDPFTCPWCRSKMVCTNPDLAAQGDCEVIECTNEECGLELKDYLITGMTAKVEILRKSKLKRRQQIN